MSEDGEVRYGCPTCLSVFRLEFTRCPIDGTPLEGLVRDPLVGRTLADRYLIEECVGEGGMGRVYCARHQRVSRRFAIKILFGDLATDSKMRARFAREAEAASRLSHPNVISVMDFGESKEGLLYLAMDFVEGPELAEEIRNTGPFATDRVRSISRQLCLGLQHAHEEGLVHRDFKGENVILAKRGDVETPRIVDFGIAVMLEDTDERLTTQGLIIGTPAYMSPEQATGKELDARSDLFSLGVLMYEMLSGVKPFDGEPMQMAMQNLSVDAPPIAQRVPGLDVDPVLESVARKLMAKRPENRYQTAGDVLAAMEEEKAFGVVHFEPEEETPPPKNYLPFAFAGLLLLGGAGLGVLVLGGSEKATEVSNQEADAAVAVAAAVFDASIPVSKKFTYSAELRVDAAPADAVPVNGTPPAAKPPAGNVTARPKNLAKATVAETPAKSPAGNVTARPKSLAKAAVAETPAKPGAKPVVEPTARAENDSDSTPTPVSAKALTSLYISVGEAINGLPQSADLPKLRSQYSAIPFQDALRIPKMRAEVETTLRRLAKQARNAKTQE